MMKRLARLHKNSRGFTLVELMIVVAIIGILAAIAIPNFRTYQLKAKRGEVPSNLKAIKVAEIAWQAERDTFVALTASPRALVLAVADAAKVPWANLGGFDTIGWQPTGPVYGSYAGAAAGAQVIGTAITLTGQSNVDGDGVAAVYTAIADVLTPANESEPTLPVALANAY